MKNKKRLLPQISELEKSFFNTFKPSKGAIIKISPASIMFLGDHTHYNDGILLSSAVQKYVSVIFSRRKDTQKNLLFNDTLYNLSVSKDELAALKKDWVFEYLIELIDNLEEREGKKFGFDALVDVDIPVCLGLGRYAALGSAFLKAFKEAYGFQYSEIDLVNITQGTEKQIIELISNRGHHFTAFLNPPKSLVLTDLRKDHPDFIPFPTENYRIILTDTQIDIKNPSAICNERIEECQVGVKGLRLYIWGIKNLRDVKLDFLKQHIHMIPRLVYKRCYYNVTERKRVEEAIKNIEKKKLKEFGKLIFDSHNSLNEDYDLSTEHLNFIVNNSKELPGVIGSKMISCSPRRSAYHIVKKENSDEFIDKISTIYRQKYDSELEISKIKFSEGAEFLN